MDVREISVATITDVVRRLCIEANTVLGDDAVAALEASLAAEESPVGQDIFRQLLRNAEIARTEGIPLCQDTGVVVVFLEIGQDVHLTGGDLEAAVNEGVRRGYRDGCLRASTLDPLTRKNFGDNTPAVIHTRLVPGDHIRVSLAPKGFGSENMSQVVLFPPSHGIDGIKKFVVGRVDAAGPNPCPPVVVGVGIGGTMEKAALLSKQSLLRDIGRRHPDPAVARLELELLEEINNLGIGPQGLGGRITALDVHIETYPTHIASIPVAVNLQCHCARHKEAVI
ncbi:MAG: fumarate hydratase [Desulfobacterales bacterium]|jgi:fumarate hydratase subunit alpha|nr:fumarate hydratase [Desulfobacterales bacterium]